MLSLLCGLKEPLAAGVDANHFFSIDEVSFLEMVTLMGYPEVVRALLKHGVDDVNDASPSGDTVLQRAAYYDWADLFWRRY